MVVWIACVIHFTQSQIGFEDKQSSEAREFGTGMGNIIQQIHGSGSNVYKWVNRDTPL